MRIVEKICALWRTIPTNLKDAQRVMERLALDPKGGSSPAPTCATPFFLSKTSRSDLCPQHEYICSSTRWCLSP